MARAKRFVQNNNNNAIVYARYSSDAQREASIEQQIDEAKKYCDAHGLHIIKIYADKALSGTSNKRPEFQLMLNEAKKLAPGYLILWKTDRLSRDRLDSAIAKNVLRDAGVKIEYVAETLPEDEATRVLIEAIEEGLAEHFLIQHSKNVTRGMKYNAEKALYNGHKILGYTGQKNERYKIDPKTAPIVKQIFGDYVNGKPMGVIASELNNAGFRTTAGKIFTEKTLWHTLHNRSYIGEYKFGEIIIPDGFPPLVSEETFNRCQEMMIANKKGGRGAKKKIECDPFSGAEYWLTRKLFCGECGASMCASAGTSKNGKVYHYYSCNNHRRKACSCKDVPQEKLERIIASILEESINNPTVRIAIAEKVYAYYKNEYEADDLYIESIERNIKDVDRKLENIMNAIESGIFNETTQTRMKELETQKSMYQDELVAEQNRKKFCITPGHVARYLECFIGKMTEPSLRDRVLSYLVDKILVYEDRLVISFFYSDDVRSVDIKSITETLDIKDKLLDMVNNHEATLKEHDKAVEEMIESLFADSESNNSDGENFFG